MARFPSWSGWVVGAFMMLAATVVIHALVRPPHRYATSVEQTLPTGATLVGIERQGRPHLVVSSLQTDGPGTAAGLKVGDEIEDVDGLPAPTLTAFEKDVASGSYHDVDLRIRRGNAVLDIHLRRQAGAAA